MNFHCDVVNVICNSVPNKLGNESISFSDDAVYLEVFAVASKLL